MYIASIGRIPYDHAVKMMQAGLDVNTIESNLLKEFGH